MEDSKTVDVTVSLAGDVETDTDIKHLLLQVFPGMEEGNINIQLLSGGFMNNVYKADTSEGKFVVRVFTKATEAMELSAHVIIGMRAAQLAGLGADVLAYFNNGVVYGYQEGELIAPDNPKYDTLEIRRKVVKTLAAFNQINASKSDYKRFCMPTENTFLKFLPMLDQIPENFDGNSFLEDDVPTYASKETIKREVDFINKDIRDLALGNSFCHGDIWWGNILFDANKDQINLLDYDAAGYNPFPSDLASFFARARLCLQPPICYHQLPVEEEKSLCRLYIEETRRLQGNQSEVSEHDVDILFALTRLFKPFIFIYITFVVIAAMHQAEISLKEILVASEKAYRATKQEYIEYRQTHEDLFVKGWKP